MEFFRASALILLVMVACTAASSSPSARPVFTFPFLADDTRSSGIEAALLVSYLGAWANATQAYPFDIFVNITFAYVNGPELFHEVVQIARGDPEGRYAPLFVGPAYSSTVQLIATAAEVYKIPILTYGATSPYFSDKAEYPNVWRITMSDEHIIRAWSLFCQHFQWTNVVVLEEGSLYGYGVADYFEAHAATMGIRTHRVKLNHEDNIPSVLQQIRDSKIKIILSTCTWSLYSTTKQAIQANMMGKTSGYVWLFGDPAADLLAERDPSFYYGIFFPFEHNAALKSRYPQDNNLLKIATQHVQVAYDRVNVTNPFRNNVSRSDIPTALPHFWTAATLPISIARSLFIVCEAVSSFFNSTRTLPTAQHFPGLLKNFSKRILGDEVRFDARQDANPPLISFVNVRKGDHFHIIATWDAKDKLKFKPNDEAIWPDGTTEIPTDGIALEVYFRYDSAFGIIALIIVGVICVIFLVTLVVILVYFKTPVFRLASSWSLLCILLSNFLLGVCIVVYLGRPRRAFCHVHIWMWYTGYNLFLSAIIAKTWRVWIIFRAVNALERGLRVTNRQLMVYTALLMIPATILLIVRTVVDDNSPLRTLSKDRTRVFVTCSPRNPAYAYAQQGWGGIQMAVAAFLAFKTRNVPSGFNDSRYVVISVYSVCTIGLIGLILPFALKKEFPLIAVGFGAMSDVLVAIILWSTVFLPKLYVALIRPETNTRELMKQKKKPASIQVFGLPPGSLEPLLDLTDQEALVEQSKRKKVKTKK